MKALKFVVAATAAGLILGLGFVAMSPYESTPASARALPPPGKPLPDLSGWTVDDARDLLDQRGIAHETTGPDSELLGLVLGDRTVCSTYPEGPTRVLDGHTVTLSVDYYC